MLSLSLSLEKKTPKHPTVNEANERFVTSTTAVPLPPFGHSEPTTTRLQFRVLVYVRWVCVCATTKSSIIHLLQTYPPPGPFCTESAYTVLYRKKHLVLLLTLIFFYFNSISIICIFTPPKRASRTKCLVPILHPTHYLF